VGSCGSGQWGDIPVDGTTQYVNASFTGASTGSASQPWKTIQAGVNAAANDGIVAVAAGSYNEGVNVNHPVRIWGVCADQVTLAASGAALSIGASATEVHGIAVTAATIGISVSDADQVLLSEVWIHDLSDAGVWAQGGSSPTSVRMERSLIENTTGYGMGIVQSGLQLVDSAIRDVSANTQGNWGVAVMATQAVLPPKPTILVQHCVLERTRSVGLVIQSSFESTIEDTLIRDVLPSVATGENGFGVWQRHVTSDGERAHLTIRGSVIEQVHTNGILIYGGDAEIERTTVRDVDTDGSPGEWGAGIRFYDPEDVAGTQPTGTVRQSTVDRAHRVGIELWGAVAVLESVLVRDPKPNSDGEHGFGVIAYGTEDDLEPSDLVLRGCRIEGASQSSIIIGGATGQIDSTAVLDTQPRASDGAFGIAVSILTDWKTGVAASAEVTRTVIDGAYAAGLAVGGGDLIASDVIVRNIQKQVNVDDFGDGIGASATIIWLPDIIPTTLTVTRATIEGVPRAGVSNFAANVSISGSWLDCNAIDLDGEPIDGIDFVFDDLGGNDCGCGDERSECKVLTTDIGPPLGF